MLNLIVCLSRWIVSIRLCSNVFGRSLMYFGSE